MYLFLVKLKVFNFTCGLKVFSTTVHKGDWGMLFCKHFGKCFSKKGKKSLLYCLKLFECPPMIFDNFKPFFLKFLHSNPFYFS